MTRIEAGDQFPALRVETASGSTRLSDHWRQGPAVVTFMRHFGCTFCREHLEHLRARHDEITAAGARVVAVFQYTAQASSEFCAGRGLPFDCVGDPLREAYAALDIRRGRGRELYGWGVIRRAWPAYRLAGGTRGPAGGDIKQLPGTFVVAPSGRVTLAHYSANAADNPSVDVILEAVRAAAGP